MAKKDPWHKSWSQATSHSQWTMLSTHFLQALSIGLRKTCHDALFIVRLFAENKGRLDKHVYVLCTRTFREARSMWVIKGDGKARSAWPWVQSLWPNLTLMYSILSMQCHRPLYSIAFTMVIFQWLPFFAELPLTVSLHDCTAQLRAIGHATRLLIP